MTVTDHGRVTYGCRPAARCAPTNTAWREGCRHPGAVQAHQEWLGRKAEERRKRASWPAGKCLAPSHNTRYSYEMNGCRCPKAITAVEGAVRRRMDLKLKQRERDYSREFAQEIQRVHRLTGGRLTRDPRRRWRRGRMGVSSINVMMLLHGYPDSPTKAERMVAVIRLAENQQVRDERTAQMRPMRDSEIGDRVGVSDASVKRLRDFRDGLRDARHLRRLADAQWKAAVVARAEGRAGQEAERHAAAHEAKRHRQIFYARTWRRLERARARYR